MSDTNVDESRKLSKSGHHRKKRVRKQSSQENLRESGDKTAALSRDRSQSVITPAPSTENEKKKKHRSKHTDDVALDSSTTRKKKSKSKSKTKSKTREVTSTPPDFPNPSSDSEKIPSDSATPPVSPKNSLPDTVHPTKEENPPPVLNNSTTDHGANPELSRGGSHGSGSGIYGKRIPIQQPTASLENKQDKKKKKWKLFGRSKKEEPVFEVGGVVAGSFQHEGHAGFDEDSGGLQTTGLPPQLRTFFEKLDQIVRSLDESKNGVTQKEVTYVLKKYGEIIMKECIPEPPPAVVPVVSVIPANYDDLKTLYEEQQIQLSGMKNVLSTIQVSKQNLQKEVEHLHSLLDQERLELKELREKYLRVEISLVESQHHALPDSDEAVKLRESSIHALQNSLASQVAEISSKLELEQSRTKNLQNELTHMNNEKEELLTEIGQLKERLNLGASAPSEHKMTSSAHLPIGNVGSSNIPAPPPPPGAPPPPPPPGGLPPPPSVTLPTSDGLGALTSVKLKHTEPAPAKAVPNTNQLLADIRKGANLKHVDEVAKPSVASTDEGNVLNLIAKALMDRRLGIKDDSDDDDKQDWDD